MERPKSPSSEVGSCWHAHPFLSALVRAAALLIPAVVAFAFSLVASRMFPPPHSVGGRVGWWLALGTLALIVLIAVQRVARRLLPLAALLNLSLLFPDQAPARYKLARRVGSPNELKRMVDDARAASADGAEALAPQTVLELVAALSVHDRATRGHSERVRIFTDMIADELKLPEADQERLRWAALLHDVGKLNVSPSLLKKPGAPTAGEWAELKRHPEDGRRLVASIAPWLGPWALAVDHHHERFDGAGYPHQLRGQQISLAGRIVAVANSYETMTAARPYKRPLSPKAARNELVACSGAQFDPAVVRAFLNVSLGRLWRTIGISAVISQIPLLPQISSGLSRRRASRPDRQQQRSKSLLGDRSIDRRAKSAECGGESAGGVSIARLSVEDTRSQRCGQDAPQQPWHGYTSGTVTKDRSCTAGAERADATGAAKSARTARLEEADAALEARSARAETAGHRTAREDAWWPTDATRSASPLIRGVHCNGGNLAARCVRSGPGDHVDGSLSSILILGSRADLVTSQTRTSA